ncbi:sensor histidine kinase [Brumimicrobium aurantiacum]|nr:sensor histidine kinase [Brumimicrobium aurantiacum]
MLNLNLSFSQNDSIANVTFEEKLDIIMLLTETFQYSAAMKELKAIEELNPEVITESIENEVAYRLMLSRVYRLSAQPKDAIHQLKILPEIKDNLNLKLKVDFRRAALYAESPGLDFDLRAKKALPIINNGITLAEKIGDKNMIASFYNLKGSFLYAHCLTKNKDCLDTLQNVKPYYLKSLDLFLDIGDTLNYHNVLNGYFHLAIDEKSKEVDSIFELVNYYTRHSNYFPNLITSRNLLGHYYMLIKQDSLAYYQQKVLEKETLVKEKTQNSDNIIQKLKLLYEFDSLKANIDLNRGIIEQKDLAIIESNKRIKQNIIFSLLLGTLSVILIISLIRQKRLVIFTNKVNKELNKANNNYELLLKESNHRIKNNLQMIMSIIELDKNELPSDENKVLENISSKITTIASLHKLLDFKEHNQKVDLRTYFNEILNYFENFTKKKLKFSTNFSDIKIKSEKIIYFGLVLNEIISNTIQHRGVEGKIEIAVVKEDELYVFTYRDYSSFGKFEKNNGIILIEDLIKRFEGFNYSFNGEIGEYKFYFYD